MTHISHAQARAMGLEKPKPKKPQRVSNVQWDAGTFPGGCWLQVPFVPPSLNEWSRWHWTKQKRYKDELTGNVKLLVMATRLPRFERATLQVIYYFPDRRKRDKDNYNGKWIIDALRYAGIIAEDNADVLRLPEPKFEVDKDRSRTEIFIWEDK